MWPKFRTQFARGWLAMVCRGARIDIAHVIFDAGKRPQIGMLDSFAIDSDEGEALQRLAQARPLKKFRCTTMLNEGDYRLVQVEAPAVAADERRQAVRWRLKDAVDFPVDTAALDLLDIPVEGGRQPLLLAVVAPRDKVAAPMAAFHQAKLALEAIDIPELAVRNVAALFEEANRGLAFLLLTDEDSFLVITHGGELCLSRRIEMTASALTPDDMERRLQMRERLALELQRTLDNFDRQFGFVSVSRLVVAAERDSAGLALALGENLYIPVLAMDLAEVADFAGLPELRQPERQAQGLLAIGAAMRSPA